MICQLKKLFALQENIFLSKLAPVFKLEKRLFWFFLPMLFFCFFPSSVFADANSLPSITVINLIRGNELGHEKDDLYSSLRSQWKVTSDLSVSATWLMQYSVLENKDIVNFAKNDMPHQEFGLLFEIDRNFASKSKVQYRGQGPWYFSDGLFLASYDITERKKLIDAAFTKFKKEFGYYPKTIGAWWIGADSLVYMQKKYGIVAALKAADQFELDFYSIWGSPWNISYLASKENEAIPASSWEKSSKVVILQWAARDPLRGYKDPLYSIQDFPIKSYDSTYVDYLSSIFLRRTTDNIVIGLENGGTIETFKKYYKTILEQAKKLEKEKKADIILTKDYANNFLKNHSVFSDTHYFLSKDFSSNDQSFWYNSVNFRAGILKEGENIYLVDLHNYVNKVREDYSYLPNSQSRLKITTPEIFDSQRFENQKIFLTKSSDSIQMKENGDDVSLFVGNKKIAFFNSQKVQLFSDNDTKTFTFHPHDAKNYILNILILIYGIYFGLLYLHGKKSLKHIVLLSIPMFMASLFLTQDPAFLFDKKELYLFHFFPALSFLSIQNQLIILKLLPFIILLVAYYIGIVLYPKKINKIAVFILLGAVTFLYFHFPYFPLDKSTYKIIFIVSVLVSIFIGLFAVFVFVNTKSRKLLFLFLFGITLILILLGASMFISRTKYALTPFEMESLQTIKNQKKNVILVKQIDNSIVPIYKAVRPLYKEVGEKLTGKKWETVLRPQDHILKLTDFNNKIIVVPRFLGADLSLHEMETLHIKKIFDNAQVAIYEKK